MNWLTSKHTGMRVPRKPRRSIGSLPWRPTGRDQQRAFWRDDRRGTIALLTALALPTLVMLLGLGIDVSYWATSRVELQRIADVAAMAGAAKYASTSSASASLTTAADVAEVNGQPVGTRGGDGTAMLTDTGSGYSTTVTYSSPASIGVAMRRSVPLMFAQVMLPGATTQTIGATAVAQAVPRTGGQACVLALEGIGNGVTTNDDINLSGNTTVTLAGCDLRSNASMAFSGNAHVDVADIVASGTIATSGNVNLTCTSGQSPCDQQMKGVQQIPDPLSGPYGGALALGQTMVTQPSGTAPLSPLPAGQAYKSLSFSGNGAYTLNPGVYYVAGSVSVSGNASLTGTGVTIISKGGVSISGNGAVTLTAPTTGATAGLLYGNPAGNQSIAFSGNANQKLRGAIYAPAGGVSMSGNSDAGASACLVIVAFTVTFSGNSNQTNSGCAAMGVPPLYDLPPIARLVQ